MMKLFPIKLYLSILIADHRIDFCRANARRAPVLTRSWNPRKTVYLSVRTYVAQPMSSARFQLFLGK